MIYLQFTYCLQPGGEYKNAIFEFDPKVYRDDERNYYNVVTDWFNCRGGYHYLAGIKVMEAAPDPGTQIINQEKHRELILCPECREAQWADVIETVPFWTYVHTCKNCSYLIGESEWTRTVVGPPDDNPAARRGKELEAECVAQFGETKCMHLSAEKITPAELLKLKVKAEAGRRQPMAGLPDFLERATVAAKALGYELKRISKRRRKPRPTWSQRFTAKRFKYVLTWDLAEDKPSYKRDGAWFLDYRGCKKAERRMTRKIGNRRSRDLETKWANRRTSEEMERYLNTL